jgi:hypothetical protein
MGFEVLDQLEEKYPEFTFGMNKSEEIFVNGQRTDIKLSDIDKLEKDLKAGGFIKK